MSKLLLGRRHIIQAAVAGLLMPALDPAVIASHKERPQITDGVHYCAAHYYDPKKLHFRILSHSGSLSQDR
ncbi:hypothetical protein AO726_20100 [Pseudomonas sp. TTU2014-080ASC]|nr:hypothetical protein AO726_20100 [Pseudomonas sp. TTU2014-080ASC]